MSAVEPSWPHIDCPPWCVGAHREDDLYDDRVHQGEVVTFPALLLERTHLGSATQVRRVTVGTHFDVTRYRHVDDDDTWIFLGDDAHQIDLNASSARRLLRALETVLRD